MMFSYMAAKEIVEAAPAATRMQALIGAHGEVNLADWRKLMRELWCSCDHAPALVSQLAVLMGADLGWLMTTEERHALDRMRGVGPLRLVPVEQPGYRWKQTNERGAGVLTVSIDDVALKMCADGAEVIHFPKAANTP